MRRILPAVIAAALLLTAAGVWWTHRDSSTAARLLVGIQDDRLSSGDPNTDVDARLNMVAGLDAKLTRVDLRWDQVATRRPANPTNPGDPAYDWHHYDAVVAAASAHHVQVEFTVWGTPTWAGDTSTPDQGMDPAGRHPTDPADAGAFAEAAAHRYAKQGVHLWEAWNEPNINRFLRPQCERVNGTWRMASPRLYAGILRAMYRGIKAADPGATVAGGVTSPSGLPPKAGCVKVLPKAFIRALNAPGLRPPMDAYAHHPYPTRRPTDKNFAGAGYIDLYNLDVLTSTLDATYLRDKPIWISEFGVATRRVKQYPYFTDLQGQVTALDDAFRRVRANPRVTLFVWYLLQDHPDWASGLFDEQGNPKPAAAAFQAQAGR